MKRSHEVEATESITHTTGQKLNYAIIGALVLALGFVTYNYALEDDSGQTGVLPNSVAVLLFDNLSPDPDDAYFAAGLHDEILRQLASLSNLTVISRTSVLRYTDSDLSIPEIARELNVETVMEGSVRYANDQVRITTQLIDAETDEHLWAQTYDREFSDIFAVESDIAMNIANALEVEFSPAEQARIAQIPTDSPAAYALYLQARSLVGGAGDSSAIRSSLDQAIRLDPNFALAHAFRGLEYAYSLVQSIGVAAAEATERASLETMARQSAQRALQLDPNLAAAHMALASIDQLNWRWSDAQEGYERALTLSPNDVDILGDAAFFKSYQGEHAEAIQLSRLLVKLAPVANSYRNLGNALGFAGDAEAALAPLNSAVELAPTNPLTRIWLGHINGILGNDAEAAANLTIAWGMLERRAAPIQISTIAYAYSQIGYSDDARRILNQLGDAAPDRDFDAGAWVLGYLVLGEEENAYQSLQTVVNRINNNEPDGAYFLLMLIKWNLYSDPVLDQPRFAELRRQIGSTN